MTPTPEGPTPKVLRLRQGALRAIAAENGWIKRRGDINATRLAAGIGVETTTVIRQIHEEGGPSAQFVAQLAGCTGRSLDELFEVVDADSVTAVAAS